MTFRNKILLSIWGVVVSLLVITFFIINYWTRGRIHDTFLLELQTASSAVRVHEKLQDEQLTRACAVIGESPRLRAVAELGDARTAAQLLRELNQSTLGEIIVLTDRRGKPLVQLHHGNLESWDTDRSGGIRSALQGVPASEVWSYHHEVYRMVSVPVLVGQDLVGTLTIGFEITVAELSTLKHAVSSDLVLFSEGVPIISTLDSTATQLLFRSGASLPGPLLKARSDSAAASVVLWADNEQYLASMVPLDVSDLEGTTGFLIVKPLSQEVRAAMASILGTFALVSVVFLVLTTTIGMVISRSMTHPIAELVRGTTEITRGNYDHVIRVEGRDELSLLARQFMEMSASLKEKISQRDALNRDLLERNTALDDTLRKLRETQEELVRTERLAATGKLTAQLAHEINNPIHNIQSCLSTAINRLAGDAKGRDLIMLAHSEAGRLSRLTGQMLSLYRNTMVEDTFQPLKVAEILGEMAALVDAELKTAGVVVRLEIDPDLPPLSGSRDKLKQVFLNLIVNARDAMPSGGDLLIRAGLRDSTIRVSIKDSGVGIAKENLGKVFDAFFTTKGGVSGVGLGLSVCYGIVNQHQGSIEVESTPGHGATFTVILPIRA